MKMIQKTFEKSMIDFPEAELFSIPPPPIPKGLIRTTPILRLEWSISFVAMSFGCSGEIFGSFFEFSRKIGR